MCSEKASKEMRQRKRWQWYRWLRREKQEATSNKTAILPAQKGDETALAASLVTCAQYQLFLDAQRLVGRFCQPDHWKAAAMPEDQGFRPILGVRASDAQAFCQWLTEQETQGWQYRLPGQDDRDRFAESEEAFFVGLPPGSGYWVSTGTDIAGKEEIRRRSTC